MSGEVLSEYEEQCVNAAKKLRDVYETGTPCPPIRSEFPEGDLDSAYRIQDINTQIWIMEGRRAVGRKIGLTSKAVQEQLKVDQPDDGILFGDCAVCDGDEIPFKHVCQPKIEAEVALVLKKDLTSPMLTVADLIRSIDFMLPALEIVGSRVENWDISIVDTIADNASSGLFVLGTQPKSVKEVDLRLCGMTMSKQGEEVSTGTGQACLGNPLNAALWLANLAVLRGEPLMAGDLVLTGALGPMTAVEPGNAFEATIEGLGSVRVAFGQE